MNHISEIDEWLVFYRKKAFKSFLYTEKDADTNFFEQAMNSINGAINGKKIFVSFW